jgi:hypothetical protein
MEIKQVMVAAPIESFSLAAVQWKMSVFPAWRLQCRCGWSVVGRIENDEFVADSPGSVLG